jgi:hypothetical protein
MLGASAELLSVSRDAADAAERGRLGYVDGQWNAALTTSLDEAADAVSSLVPEVIEPRVRQIAQAAISSWRSDGCGKRCMRCRTLT